MAGKNNANMDHRGELSSAGHVTQWLENVKRDDDDLAAQKIWDRYCHNLLHIARDRLCRRNALHRVADEEDVVLQAFEAFFRAARQGQLSQCRDRNDLWRLLVVITENQAYDIARRERRQKRGGGAVRGDSAVLGTDSSPAGGFDRLAGPSSGFADLFVETCDRLLSLLSEEERQIVFLKTQGFSQEEIAEKIGRVPETVSRKLKVIRHKWQQEIRDVG
jgi:RNA polymerase sigma factor (sigma-70 family)